MHRLNEIDTYADWNDFGAALLSGRAQWYGGAMPEAQIADSEGSRSFAHRNVLPQVVFA